MLQSFICLLISEHLGPEGCRRGWYHFNDFCYLVVDAHVHFDSAKAICMVKGATLTSLWGKDEIEFLTNLLNDVGFRHSSFINKNIISFWNLKAES